MPLNRRAEMAREFLRQHGGLHVKRHRDVHIRRSRRAVTGSDRTAKPAPSGEQIRPNAR